MYMPIARTIQALLFSRDKYNVESASLWAHQHGHHPLKYHVTPNFVRARLIEPPNAPMRMISLGPHIRAVVVVPTSKTMPPPRRRAPARRRGGATARRPPLRRARRATRYRGGFMEYFDRYPSLLENLVTTALVGAAAAGIYHAVKKKKE
jgi:hypothetical protein